MISLAHKTVFVHIPKCGGQSIEYAYCEDLGLDWERHRRLLLMMRRPLSPENWPGQAERLAHLRAKEYVEQDYIPKSLWEDFYTFSIVRNPFSRLASTYVYSGSEMTFDEYIRWVAGTEEKQRIISQVAYLSNGNGDILVDDVYRLEELSDRWPEIKKRSELSVELRHRNRGKSKDAVIWSMETKEIVREVYAEDFAKFGYDLETGAIVA